MNNEEGSSKGLDAKEKSTEAADTLRVRRGEDVIFFVPETKTKPINPDGESEDVHIVTYDGTGKKRRSSFKAVYIDKKL